MDQIMNSLLHSSHLNGEGNGNPLQYSCPENPTDRRAWRATVHAAAAAAKLLQSCPTLCDPIDSSPPGSPIPEILQARTLERVAISFSNTLLQIQLTRQQKNSVHEITLNKMCMHVKKKSHRVCDSYCPHSFSFFLKFFLFFYVDYFQSLY